MRPRRFYLSESAEKGVNVDLSPLIDVVFLLLIFFIVTTVFVEDTGVDIQKPRATASVDLEKNSILLAVTSDNRIVYGKEEISLNRVRGIVARQIRQKDVPVIIQADTASRTGLFVDVQDECKLAGARRVFISTVQE